MKEPFVIVEPSVKVEPIILSVPHCGVEFPKDLAPRFVKKFVTFPEDTDWHVHKLYDFAASMGVTLIHARYSRYVIDLNRDPEGRPLYSDSRRETSLVPTHSFAGENLYVEDPPQRDEIDGRLKQYYWPYYVRVSSLIEQLKSRFKHVLFYDAHSIKHFVPSIQPEPFPDMILGNQDGKTSDPRLFETALRNLSQGPFRVSANRPFKGGHLTRYFGTPSKGIHALQLEMSQKIYMDEETGEYEKQRAQAVRQILERTLNDLLRTLRGLP